MREPLLGLSGAVVVVQRTRADALWEHRGFLQRRSNVVHKNTTETRRWWHIVGTYDPSERPLKSDIRRGLDFGPIDTAHLDDICSLRRGNSTISLGFTSGAD